MNLKKKLVLFAFILLGSSPIVSAETTNYEDESFRCKIVTRDADGNRYKVIADTCDEAYAIIQKILEQ